MLKVGNIRSEKWLEGQKNAMARDIEKLIKQKSNFVEVSCPACGGKRFLPKFEKNGFKYVECEECLTFYMNPRPTQKILEAFLEHSENYAYWSRYIFPTSEAERRKRIFKPRVERVLELCEKYGIEPKALLEVGAGFGTFSEELRSKKIFEKVIAIEPSPNLASKCRKRGIEVLETPVESVDPKNLGLFDAVVNFEVIEHLFSPREFILKCGQFLKPGGIFVVTCPNGLGFDIKTLGILSDTIDHEHLNYFNPASLARLMQECGFRILESQTPGELDAELVRNQALSGKFNLDQKPLLKHLLIDEWENYGEAFQQFLVDHRLSSSMWFIAQSSR